MNAIMNLTKKEFQKRYDEEKKFFLDYWRPIILKKDKYRCVNCNEIKELQLAHITPCYDFVKKYGFEEGMSISFQMDNLVSLCEKCHMTYHQFVDGIILTPKNQKIAREVANIFDKIIERRGWKGTGIKKFLKNRQGIEIKSQKIWDYSKSADKWIKRTPGAIGLKKKNITANLTEIMKKRQLL